MHVRLFAAVALLALFTACSSTITTPGEGSIPKSGPTANPNAEIKHIVILFQENRSFNSMFMGFPGAETSNHGACRAFKAPGLGHTFCPENKPVKLRQILLESKCFPSCQGGADIAHQYGTFKTESDEDPSTGLLRGWVRRYSKRNAGRSRVGWFISVRIC